MGEHVAYHQAHYSLKKSYILNLIYHFRWFRWWYMVLRDQHQYPLLRYMRSLFDAGMLMLIPLIGLLQHFVMLIVVLFIVGIKIIKQFEGYNR